MHFGDLTRPELQALAARGAVVLVPVGATEQHGPHLPADTDTFLAHRFASDCAARLEDVIVAPPIPWGLSAGHTPLGATITIRPAIYSELLLDVAHGLADAGFHRQVWVNGHNSNRPALAILVYECQQRWGLSVAAVNYYDFGGKAYGEGRRSELGGEFHAGELETSIMLALDPARVGSTEGVGRLATPLTSYDFFDVAKPGPASIGFPYAKRFPDGVAGDPSTASAELGSSVAAADLEGLVRFVEEYRAAQADDETTVPGG